MIRHWRHYPRPAANLSASEFPPKLSSKQLHFGCWQDPFAGQRADMFRELAMVPQKQENAFCGKIECCLRWVYGRPHSHGVGTPRKTCQGFQENCSE